MKTLGYKHFPLEMKEIEERYNLSTPNIGRGDEENKEEEQEEEDEEDEGQEEG